MKQDSIIGWGLVLLCAFVAAVYLNAMGWFYAIGETGFAYFCGLLAIGSGALATFCAINIKVKKIAVRIHG